MRATRPFEATRRPNYRYNTMFEGARCIVKQEISIPDEPNFWDYGTTCISRNVEKIKTEVIEESYKITETPKVEKVEYDGTECINNSQVKRFENEMIDVAEEISGTPVAGPFSKFETFCQKCNSDAEVIESTVFKECQTCRIRMVIRCGQCNLHFRDKCRILDHSRESCNPAALHNCKYCNYTTYNRTRLRKHTEAKHESNHCNSSEEEENNKSKLFHCNDCGYTNKQKWNVSQHIKINHMQFEGFHKCSKCGKRFTYVKSKKSHEEICDSLLRKCQFCEYETKNRSKLERHKIIHDKFQIFTQIEKTKRGKVSNISETITKTAIVVLDRMKASQTIMQTKKLRSSKSDLKSINLLVEAFCSNCNETQGRDWIKRLCRKCRRLNEFRCLERDCGNKYSKLYHIRDHIRRQHVNLDQGMLIKCPTCGKGFGHHRNLKWHQRGCGKAPGLKCEHCEYVTKWPNHLVMHTRKKHSDVIKTSDDLACDKCNRKFPRMLSLKTHRRYCGKTTSAFRCANCLYFSVSRTSLVAHLKTEHGF